VFYLSNLVQGKKNLKNNKHKKIFVRNFSYLCDMIQQNKKSSRIVEPTKSELEILQILWKTGPSTVRFVNDHLNAQKREVNYTSTLKLMQIMVEKGILKRDESNMKHVYETVLEEQKTKGFLLERFIDSLYQGSASSLMMQLLGNKKTSNEEVNAIKEILNKMGKNK